MFDNRKLWTLQQDLECTETQQLIRCVPHLDRGIGQRALYIGASWGRQMCLPVLLDGGWNVAVVESYLPNAEWLAKQGVQVVHGLIQDCLELLPMADAVFWIHGPEHCSREDADLVMAAMAKRPLAVVMAPVGGEELDGPQYDNNREAHRWFVQADDFPGWERNILDRPGNPPNLLAWSTRSPTTI